MIGTVRATTPQQTLARITPIAKQLGITRLANITGLDQVGIPVWMAVRPMAKSLTVSQGKGLTDDLSKCSALMEGIETYHAEQVTPDGEDLPLGTYRDDVAFVDPMRLPRKSAALPSDDSTIFWAKGRNVISGRPGWIPNDLFALDTTARRAVPATFVTSTNGLASGNTDVEALLHGICEVVERDQVARWLQQEMLTPGSTSSKLRLSSVHDPSCRAVIEQCERIGLELHVWCTTVDLGLPVFWAAVADANGSTCFPHRAIGSGCHPCKAIALSRALTEALQIRLSNISGLRDDVGWRQYRSDAIRCPADWVRELRSRGDNLEFEAVDEAPSSLEIPDLLEYALRKLTTAAVQEIIAVDLSLPQIGIPVVFVCIPDRTMAK